MTPPKLCGDCGTQMEVNPDLFALPGLDATPNGLVFNTSRALPVTVYICPNCGRFKFMSAIMLNNIEPVAPAQGAPAQGAPQQAAVPPNGQPPAAEHSET